jgi:ABC-type branched-subunit amino acid transport system ATPase component
MTKRFGRVVIAEDLSFSVGAGETVGIVGPNGAGKTSLFGLISGDLAPNAGQVSFAGRNVTRLDSAARCRLGIGRTYQVPRPFVDMTVRGINAEGIAVIWIEHVVRALTSLVTRMTCLYGGSSSVTGPPPRSWPTPGCARSTSGATSTPQRSRP